MGLFCISFFELNSDGNLNNSNYSETHDINYNIWNLDLSYAWEFAPGSQLVALYRNQLFNSTSESLDSFKESLADLFDQDIQHTFSVKMIYFLDYNSLKRVFKKNEEVKEILRTHKPLSPIDDIPNFDKSGNSKREKRIFLSQYLLLLL